MGVATPTPNFPGFPAGVTSGSYQQMFDLTQAAAWNAACINANGGTPESAEAAFGAGLAAERANFNIHTSFVGSGENRGFLQVPEPGTVAPLAIGLAGLAGFRRPTR